MKLKKEFKTIDEAINRKREPIKEGLEIKPTTLSVTVDPVMGDALKVKDKEASIVVDPVMGDAIKQKEITDKAAEDATKASEKVRKEISESIKVKDRHELSKLISEAKKCNKKFKISKSLEEGFRYIFETLNSITLNESDEEDLLTEADERINLKKYGFVRAPEKDFNDDGSRFTCYYYDPEKTGDKRIELSKLVDRGDAYIDAQYYSPKLGKTKYFSDLNGVSISYAINKLPKLKQDLDDFLKNIDEYDTVRKLTDEDIKELAEEINYLTKRAGLNVLDATKRAFINKEIDKEKVSIEDNNKLMKYLRNNSPYDKEKLKINIIKYIKNIISSISKNISTWDDRSISDEIIQKALAAANYGIASYPDAIQEKIKSEVTSKIKELLNIKIESIINEKAINIPDIDISKLADEIILDLEKSKLLGESLTDETDLIVDDSSSESPVDSTPIETETVVTPEVEENAFSSMITSEISKSWDALDSCKSILATLQSEKPEAKDASTILNSIIDERTIHIGMLQKVLEDISPKQVELIKQGEEKAEEIK